MQNFPHPSAFFFFFILELRFHLNLPYFVNLAHPHVIACIPFICRTQWKIFCKSIGVENDTTFTLGWMYSSQLFSLQWSVVFRNSVWHSRSPVPQKARESEKGVEHVSLKEVECISRESTVQPESRVLISLIYSVWRAEWRQESRDYK